MLYACKSFLSKAVTTNLIYKIYFLWKLRLLWRNIYLNIVMMLGYLLLDSSYNQYIDNNCYVLKCKSAAIDKLFGWLLIYIIQKFTKLLKRYGPQWRAILVKFFHFHSLLGFSSLVPKTPQWGAPRVRWGDSLR